MFWLYGRLLFLGPAYHQEVPVEVRVDDFFRGSCRLLYRLLVMAIRVWLSALKIVKIVFARGCLSGWLRWLMHLGVIVDERLDNLTLEVALRAAVHGGICWRVLLLPNQLNTYSWSRIG